MGTARLNKGRAEKEARNERVQTEQSKKKRADVCPKGERGCAQRMPSAPSLDVDVFTVFCFGNEPRGGFCSGSGKIKGFLVVARYLNLV